MNGLINPAYVLWLSCLSLSFTLSASTLSRNALCLAALISVIDLILKKPPVKWNPALTVVTLTSALTASVAIPVWLHPSVSLHDIDRNYLTAATRMLLGVIVAYYLVLQREGIRSVAWKAAGGWVVVGFVYTVFFALRQGITTRLEINTVATMTAYVFAVLSLAVLFITLRLPSGWRTVSMLLMIAVSGYILLLTQTRAVLLTWPLLVLVLLGKERFFTRRNSALLLVMLLAALVSGLPKIERAAQRIMHSVTEYQSYQNNNENTSLGARFSMWRAGWHAVSGPLFGISADERDHRARRYIIQHENGNPEALKAIVNHYHNDLLEAVTLRGLVGLAVLILFYAGSILASRRFTGNYNTALLLIVPTILYGSTDTLLIDHRYVTILVLLLPFYLCSPAPVKPGNHVIRQHGALA